MRVSHQLPNALIAAARPIRVLVVGAGGTGSAIVMQLPYLDQALRVWGRTEGLDVVLVDPDVISETNCVRQPFALSDVGQYKSIVLINRINTFWGKSWKAVNYRFTQKSLRRARQWQSDLVIGCVDSKRARKNIHLAITMIGDRTSYWLDLGNNAASGQFILGQPLNTGNRKLRDRLPTIAELYPEIIDTSLGEDSLPSCSALEALERQEPFINQTLATAALAMLARLFRYGRLDHHGGFFNAQIGAMSALPIDPQSWGRKVQKKESRKSKMAA
jgi:PRTRC genetic system ThiF family protein